MTNKIDETPDSGSEKIVVPQHELLSDSGTRREAIADGWWWVKISPEDDDEAAWVKDNNVYPSRMDCTAIGPMDAFLRWYPLAQFLAPIPPPASLAAKDEEIARLKIALADAIRRPMGVIPDSAAGLVAADELDEAEKRRTAETSSLAAMREAIEVAREVFTQFEEGCGKPISFNLLSTLGQKLAAIDSTTPPAPNDDGLAKLLREIEWRGDVFDDFMKVCPFCESDNVVGHREDCSLARWIAKVEGR